MENCEYLHVQELAGNIEDDITKTNGPNTGTDVQNCISQLCILEN